jgi:uncharacterized protein (TIGR02466 family)
MPNVYNNSSRNTSILELPALATLKTNLTEILTHAFNAIHRPVNNVTPYITQSWINYTKPGEKHHQHIHVNSLYSAVFYLKTTPGDCIEFIRPPNHSMVGITPYEFTPLNSETWKFPVSDDMVVIFPSNLLHEVPIVTHNNLRVSLSFNSFIFGEIGSPDTLNYLHLGKNKE